MTRVPEHWIPLVPAHKDGDNRWTKLQRAAMPRVLEGDPNPPVRVRPRTALMREGLAENPRVPLFVEPEEVPRTGIQVFDGFRRTRWYNGQTFVWRGVQKRTGRGEGSSGPSYDDLVPKRAAKSVAVEPPVPPVGHAPQEASAPIPGVSLVVHPDPVSGFNLGISATDHLIAPGNASTPHVDGEGHLHLYVNGIKITRVYENWFHLPALTPGQHKITVELSTNSHAPLAHMGERIAAMVPVDQSEVAPHMHAMGEEAVSDPGSPGITLAVSEDPAGGYNLQSTLESFSISASNAGTAHVRGEGHLHLFVNDVKASRIYGAWHYLPKLGVGVHKVRMALYTNDHRPYVKAGEPISSEVEIVVEGRGGAVPGGHVHP